MAMCRTCLKKPADKPILALERVLNEDKKNCSEIMQFCLDIEVTEDSKISTNLCYVCYRKIISFYKFKTLSLKNDQYLKTLYPVTLPEDQNVAVYVDEHGIEHENPLETDDYGSCVVEEYGTQIKEEDGENEHMLENEEPVDAFEIYANHKGNEEDGENEDVLKNEDLENEEPVDAIEIDAKHIGNEEDGKDEHMLENQDLENEEPLNAFEIDANDKGNKEDGKDEHMLENQDLENEEPLDAFEIDANDKSDEEDVWSATELPDGHDKPILKCKVPGCPKFYATSRGQQYHYRTAHLGLKYTCDICDKEVTNLARHKNQAHKQQSKKNKKIMKSRVKERSHLSKVPKSVYQICEECGVAVRNLKDHSVQHQPQDQRKLLPCKAPECPRYFFTPRGRKYHYRTAHLGIKFSCDICDKEVANVANHKQQAHKQGSQANKMKKRMKERAYKMCEECGISVRHLKEHSVQHQSKDQRKLLPCEAPECTKEFLSVIGRKRHYQLIHLGLKNKIKCDICSKEVTNILQHKQYMHNRDAMRYACASCGLRCISASALTLHMGTHTNACPFECDTCQKKFRTKNFLRTHIRRMHEKERKYRCEYCPKEFFKKYCFRDHLRQHTKECPFKCEECGKGFARTGSLKSHRLLHRNEKFQCEVCAKSFGHSRYLSRHMDSHTKDKKYPCRYCGRLFGRSDNRRTHETKSHKKALTTD